MVYAIFSASVLLAIGAIYAGAVGWLYFRQERLLFEPDPLPADEPICRTRTPASSSSTCPARGCRSPTWRCPIRAACSSSCTATRAT